MAKIKICLDAGHYGKYNRSPAVKEYYESDMNWKLHNMLKKYLEEYGFEVIQTRAN
jgi:N-acetylmuramoyl-L-alanine amidase